ncbi:MAG TPA: DUF6114 domain-containing protein [Candidatus Eisenbacteria bacterium]|nr:DUF6114 domain-containing protein [Candidatus Eisenbacteria bacterium]
MSPLGHPMRGLVSALRWTRAAFRGWRRTRPFWAGLWCVAGGAIIAYGPTSAFKVILVSGTTVWLGIVVGLLVLVMGLFLWFAPSLRHPVGILAAMFATVSLFTSDYGGFVIGLVLGTVGGALGFAWTPARAGRSRA